MKVMPVVLLVIIYHVSACKAVESSSRNKSFVGLNAELDESVLRGEAPSFLYLQKWFKQELPVDISKAQAGDVTYRVHGEFTQTTFNNLPAEYKQRLLMYLKQQRARVGEFQANLKNPTNLRQLFRLEADEMADILRALIDPNHTPQTNDLLAHLIAHKPLRNFIDRYSIELLEKLYTRSQRSLLLGIETERSNFLAILTKTMLTSRGATPSFVASLLADCAKLNNIISALGDTTESNCSSMAQVNLTDLSLQDSARLVGGSSGRAIGIFGSLASADGFAARSVSPKLRIFSGRDPNANDPHVSSGPGSGSVISDGATLPPASEDKPSSPSVDKSDGTNMLALLISLFSGMGSGPSGYSLNGEPPATRSATIPPRPRGVCNGKTGLELVVCQRYIETLPRLSDVVSRQQTDESGDFSLNSSPDSMAASVGYNFFMISKYATRVQNQGSEGACTAFGMAHVLGILGKIKGKSGEYDAWNIWRKQGQQMYVTASISAVKRMTFDGLSVSSVRSVGISTSSLKRVLDAGRPIYFASDVDSSWNGANRGNADITCRGSRGIGHAYALVGYDDRAQRFVIKNSWGDYWGDQGYGYLPYSCIGRMNESAHDVQLD